MDARLDSGRYAITPSQAKRLRRELGRTQDVDGLTPSEVAVLAALRGAPLGLVSARAVARRGRLSPTAAARALRSLLAKDLVVRASETIAAGRAREAEVWHANHGHPRWHELEPVLGRVEPPETDDRTPAGERVPKRLRHLFWNTAESQLDTARAGPYIARRLLRTLDLQGLAWGAGALSPEDWRQGARARGLDSDVRKLALNLAESAR